MEAIKQFHRKKYRQESQSVHSAGLFSTFGFAFGGSIVIENENYSMKVVVSPIDRIRQTAVERK